MSGDPNGGETRWKMGQHRGEKRTEEVEGKKTGTAMIGSEVGALTSQCLKPALHGLLW